MKKTSALLAVAMLSASPALSDSLTNSATASAYAGFYLGVHGGQASFGSSTTAVGARLIEIIENNPISASDFDASPGGRFAGVQLGYNVVAAPNFLWGIEATYSSGDLSSTILDPAGDSGLPDTITSSIEWDASLRARAGMIFGSSLVYGLVGMATGDVSISMTAPLLADESGRFSGWVIGAGVEHMISDTISLKAEYAYTDLGDRIWFAEDVNDRNYAINADLTGHQISIGLNYHF